MQSCLRAVFKLPSWQRSFCQNTASWRPKLQAIARLRRGSGGAKFHRARGLVSAVIYDGMPSQAVGAFSPSSSLTVFLREEEVSFCFKKMGHHVFMSTVFILHIWNSLKLQVEAYEERVLPRTINFDGSGRIINIRFIRAPTDIKLKLNCPIVIVGAKNCAGILRGGLLREYYRFIPLSCTPDMLPTFVEVNISKLDIGGQVLVGDIKLKVDVHPDMDPTSPICEIASQEC